ncbi:MAG: hypothetical protein JW952_05440 [Candidatus Eisenbacteria bacterium]|nr:hypothetical protein [Candidatus Eisenbacteria bacterium]
MGAESAVTAPESTSVAAVVGTGRLKGAAQPAATKKSGVEPPYRVVLRSLLYPGWGQLYNGRSLKALAVFVGEGALLGMMYSEGRAASRAYDAHLSAPDDATAAELYADYEHHFERQESLIWWAAGLVLLSLADAYVDAHLLTFEEEFGQPAAKVSVSFEPGGLSRGGFVCLKCGF